MDGPLDWVSIENNNTWPTVVFFKETQKLYVRLFLFFFISMDNRASWNSLIQLWRSWYIWVTSICRLFMVSTQLAICLLAYSLQPSFWQGSAHISCWYSKIPCKTGCPPGRKPDCPLSYLMLYNVLSFSLAWFVSLFLMFLAFKIKISYP